jgi:ribosome-binding protein aMBF1 (putative translation factor)
MKLQDNIQRAVAFALQDYMRRKGISQRALARLLNKESSYINRIVSGKVNLTLQTIEELEAALEITLVYPAMGVAFSGNSPSTDQTQVQPADAGFFLSAHNG